MSPQEAGNQWILKEAEPETQKPLEQQEDSFLPGLRQWEALREGRYIFESISSKGGLGSHCVPGGAMVATELQRPHFSFISDWT